MDDFQISKVVSETFDYMSNLTILKSDVSSILASDKFFSREFGKDCFSISGFMTFVLVSIKKIQKNV
jgi:hypothetical protein